MRRGAEKYEFTVPTSLKECRVRINEITVSVMNVEKQLGDRRREKTMASADYATWRERTKAARIFMVSEQRFLKDWLLERRRRLLAKDGDIWPLEDPRVMLQRVVAEGRKSLRGEPNCLIEVLDTIDLFLTHDA